MEYCDICLLPWRDLCLVVPPNTWETVRCVDDLQYHIGPYRTNRFASALDLDERRVELHESLEAFWDIDRNFIKNAIEEAKKVYDREHDITKAYDVFIDYLKDIAERPLYERHPDLAFLRDVQGGKYDSELSALGMPSLSNGEE